MARAQQPHSTQKADQEAPAAAHSRSGRSSPRVSESPALGRRPRALRRTPSGPAPGGAPPPGRLPGPPSLLPPLRGRHLPAEPADVQWRPRWPPGAWGRLPSRRVRLTHEPASRPRSLQGPRAPDTPGVETRPSPKSPDPAPVSGSSPPPERAEAGGACVFLQDPAPTRCWPILPYLSARKSTVRELRVLSAPDRVLKLKGILEIF